MNQIVTEIRKETGKGVARKLRNAGKIPGVLYAQGVEPVALSVDLHSLKMAMQAGGFYTHKHTINVDGKATEVLARDVQRDPVSDKYIHIDFMRFDPNKEVRVTVPVHVSGEDDSPGLDKGGVLQLLRAELELLCKASNIPEAVEISMAGKDIGDAVKLSDIELPEGAKSAIFGRDFTIASIVGTRSSTMADLEAGDGEEAEGEGEEAAE